MIDDGLHDVPPGKLAMVVTHLEMRTPPANLPDASALPALPEGVHFDKMPADVARYRALFDKVGRDWLWFGRRKLSDAALAEILNAPGVTLHVLRRDGRDLGLLELDFRTAGNCELAYFGLAQELIGGGVGRWLMGQAIRMAWAQPIKRFHLHTCTIDSPQAMRFYQRSGFTPVRQQIEIADDPRLIGLIPPDAAPHVPVFSGLAKTD